MGQKVLNFTGGALCVLLLVVFMAICIIGSGYHWE